MPKGDLKFNFLPEQEIQIFGQTDLVTKIVCGVGQQFHLTRNKQPRRGVWMGQRISRRTLTRHIHHRKNSAKSHLYIF